MKKLISRVCCLCCVVLVLAACLPFSAFAVDPVSAGVMANAFAQAIAAYGASNGVAMTFDVTSTDGIGETVHELWKDFREGTQDADDYATLAAALFPDLYYKASSVVAGAADVYSVGYNISSTYAEEFDNFYNWLLSGPAEMVKVDNSYYQFSSAQIGADSSPLVVVSLSNSGFLGQPVVSGYRGQFNASAFSNGLAVGDIFQFSCPAVVNPASDGTYFFYSGGTIYSFNINNYSAAFSLCMLYQGSSYIDRGNVGSLRTYSYNGINYTYSFISEGINPVYLPFFSTMEDGFQAIIGDSLVSPDVVGVKAYTNTGVAVFPDTTDPNYEAVGKQIPSTVPWDNTAYGDGTGTLTDAQAGAIAAGADTAIARDGVLDLAGTDEVTDEPGVDDPPTTDPDDYAVPGLAEIFPFCIPFDIYNFLSALAANPVAPHFTATLDFPEAVGGTQTIDIDFDSPTWNQLAQLLRLLELLAFIIGLALLTRSMFLRG